MAFLLSGCTEAELAAHVTKNIGNAITGNTSKSVGYFKVGSPYKIQGRKYYPKESYTLVETGIASWYGPNFHGKKTANGEIFNQHELTAAHRTLQMPSIVRVTNLENGRSIIVRVNDRGPFARGRIIDLSKRAAELLDMKVQGTAKVKVEVLPVESRMVAEVAKRGEATTGMEVAMNNRMQGSGHQNDDDNDRQRPALMAPRDTIKTAQYGTPLSQGTEKAATLTSVRAEPLSQPSVPGHITGGNFYPDPVVRTVAVNPTKIYVQAGSFTSQANAQNLAARLQSLGQVDIFPAMVNGQQFYRVRLNALNVSQADQILNNLAQAGNSNAIIVVE